MLTACNTGQSGQERKVFRYNEDAGITTLDPAFARDQAINWAVSQLYNGLVQLDENLQVAPAIAHRWEVRDSGRTYVFYLRSDVYFHDNECFENGKGRRVTARDFVYSLERIINPATASTGSWIFNDKIDLKSYNTGNYKPFVAESDSVFIIRLTKSFPPFLSLLAMPYCYVVPKEAVEKYGSDFRTHPVGTGPFMFRLWEEGVKLVMVKNPRYFETENGHPLPKIDAVEVGFVVNKQTAFMEFVAGKLDFFSGLDGSYKDELLTRNGQLKPNYKDRFVLEVNPYLNTEYIAFLQDTTSGKAPDAWYKPEVRQAVNYAIDREKMMLFLRNNIGRPAHAGIVPQGLPSFSNTVQGYPYNPGKARQLLAQAGYPQGKGLPPLVLHTNPTYVDISIYIQKQLKDVGIEVQIEVAPGPAHRSQVTKGRYGFFRGSWIADYPDAENYLSLFYSKNIAPNGPNYSRYNNPAFDQLYEQALAETNDSARYALYRQADALMMQDAPAVVLFYDQSVRLLQPWVKALKNNAMNVLALKKVEIEK